MDPRRWCVYPVSRPSLYLDMWRDLKSFLFDTIDSDDLNEYPQASEFLSLMLRIERKYLEADE